MVNESESLLTRSETYAERREKAKNGILTGCIMFFKSTCGLGLFVTQFYLAKAGLILGPLASCLTAAIIILGMYLSLKVSNDIEEKSGHTVELTTYDKLVNRTLGFKMRVLAKLTIILSIYVSINVNIINMAKFLNENAFGNVDTGPFQDLNFCKLFVMFLMLTIIFFIVEPENFKYPTYVSMVLYLTAVLITVFSNIGSIASAEELPEIDYFNFSELSNLVSTQVYSFESITMIFGIRSTLKRPSDMKKIVFIAIGAGTFMYVLNAILVLLVS